MRTSDDYTNADIARLLLSACEGLDVDEATGLCVRVMCRYGGDEESAMERVIRVLDMRVDALMGFN